MPLFSIKLSNKHTSNKVATNVSVTCKSSNLKEKNDLLKIKGYLHIIMIHFL